MATWWDITFTGDPTDTDREHVADMIRQGFTSGQLINEDAPASITTERVAEIVASVNAYWADHEDAASSDMWQAVIFCLPEFDEARTAAADPSYMSDVAVLTDGTRVEWDAQGRRWFADRTGARS